MPVAMSEDRFGELVSDALDLIPAGSPRRSTTSSCWSPTAIRRTRTCSASYEGIALTRA